jgi:hypothetical protein
MLQKRVVRFTIFALLLTSGIVAAVFAWDSQRRIHSLDTERLAIETTTERLLRAVSSISAVQQAYVDYGQRDEASFTRVAGLLRQMATDAADLQRSARDGVSAGALEQFSRALAAAADAEVQAQNSLLAGESLAAADALFDLARAPVATMEGSLRAVRDAESVRSSAAQTTIARSTWMGIGAVALLWVAGLIVLTPVPSPRVQVDVAPVTAPATVVTEAAVSPLHTPVVELDAAAAVCAEIARITDPAALPDLLRRAAAILDARGIVVWMGAGDELFAAIAYGYDPAVMSRMRPIGRRADNATAAAWRTGEMRTVAAAGTSHGAIVAPMSGAAGAFGVMAAEVRQGREDDAATRAVTAIIASQLASVLSEWPSASSADASAGDTDADAESNRQAAAS